MEIEEMKNKKKLAETQIFEICKGFEEETGMKITDIGVVKIQGIGNTEKKITWIELNVVL